MIPWRARPRPAEAGLPAVTLVTPCLNRVDFVEAAIRSARHQGYPGLRQVVVDGGSTDGTLAVLARHPEIEVVAQRSQGSHPAMNEGLTRADGEVIGFLNTDDLLLPGALHAAGRAFADDPALDAVCFRAALFETESGDTVAAHAEIVEPPPALQLDELMFGTPGFNAWFFRRRVFAVHGDFDPAFDIAGDRDFLLRLTLGGARIRHLPVLGYAYRQHAGSRTLDRDARLRLGILAEHVAIARKHLSRPDLAPADRAALSAWHARETARLLGQQIKRGRFGAALDLAVGGFWADPAWPLAITAGRRRATHLAAAVSAAARSELPMPA